MKLDAAWISAKVAESDAAEDLIPAGAMTRGGHAPAAVTSGMANEIPPCDDEVFKNGTSLCAVNGWAKDVEPWVKKVAERSGQRVDWHYSGGIAHVLVLGDYDKALAAAKALEPELVFVEVPRSDPRYGEYAGREPQVIAWFGFGEGLYRSPS